MSPEHVLGRSTLKNNNTGREENGHDPAPAPLSPPQIEVARRETAFFMNKAVADAEQPKMILCYKESTYDVIKDICVDCEGLQRDEVKQDDKSSDGEVNMPDSADLSEGQKSMHEGEVKSPRRSGRKYSLADLLAEDRELDKQLSRAAGEQPPVDSKPDQSQDPPVAHSLSTHDAEGTSAKSTSSTFDATSEEEMESASAVSEIAVSDGGAAIPEIMGEAESDARGVDQMIREKKEGEGSSEIEQCEEGAGGQTVAAPVSGGYRGNAEASLSGSSLLAGGVMYSGHLQFSGSVSLRSESSAATSNRSFAFPILQSEWNSSPIKMATVQRGRFRRRRGWHSGLFCCKY